MWRLQQIIRHVREAQGLSQKELALKVGITQSAIAQFERSEAGLSKEKISKIAPLLNLNPSYVMEDTGNIFKSAHRESVVEMILQTTIDDQIDHTLLELLISSNNKALFIFLKPTGLAEEDSRRVRKWRDQGRTSFALVVEDADSNIFFLRRKDNAFINDKELALLIRKLSQEGEKTLEIASEPISRSTYKTLSSTGDLDARASEIRDILLKHAYKDQRSFLAQLIKRSAVLDDKMVEDCDRIQKKIDQMDPGMVKSTYEHIMGQIAPILNKNL